MFSNPKFLWGACGVSAAINLALLLGWVREGSGSAAQIRGEARSQPGQVMPAKEGRSPSDFAGQQSELEALRKKLIQMEEAPGVVRRVITTMVDAQLEPQREALRRLYRSKPFWAFNSGSDRELIKAKHTFEKIREALLEKSLGELGTMSDEDRELSRIRFGRFDPELMKQCEAIRMRSRESRQAETAALAGLTMVTDQAKAGELAAKEFEAVRRVLNNDSIFEEYLLRVSPGAAVLRSTATESEYSEEEFRSIFRKYRELGGNIYSFDLVQKKLIAAAIQSVRSAPAAASSQGEKR